MEDETPSQTRQYRNWFADLPSALAADGVGDARYSSGCHQIDEMFAGRGFPSCRMIEILGGTATCKTNLALSTALVNIFAGRSVLYIETTNALSGGIFERAFRMAVNTSPFVGKTDVIMQSFENLRIVKAFSIWEVFECIHDQSAIVDIDIVIVDSFVNLFGSLIGKDLSSKAAAPSSSGGGSGGASEILSSLMVSLRSLCSLGKTVIVVDLPRRSVLPQTIKEGDVRKGKYAFRSGMDSILEESFDITMLLQRDRLHVGNALNGDPVVRADVIRRPPYYGSAPSSCVFKLTELYQCAQTGS
jgi:archaellum biogenesis ATPase FlaH